MDTANHSQLQPGVRVKITQQIAARHYSLPTAITGTIVSYSQKETGSWYAHSRDGRLWLDRVVIKKDDGELSTLILDEFTKIEVLSGEPLKQ